MAGFNENHKSYLRATFLYVDELLSETQRVLGSGKPLSPFSRHIADATPIQQKVIADYATRARAEMLALLKSYQADLPQPDVSAVWAARCALRVAQIAIEELGPCNMRGFGELSDSAMNDLNGLVSQLLNLLKQMESCLAQGTSGYRNHGPGRHFAHYGQVQYPDD